MQGMKHDFDVASCGNQTSHQVACGLFQNCLQDSSINCSILRRNMMTSTLLQPKQCTALTNAPSKAFTGQKLCTQIPSKRLSRPILQRTEALFTRNVSLDMLVLHAHAVRCEDRKSRSCTRSCLCTAFSLLKLTLAVQKKKENYDTSAKEVDPTQPAFTRRREAFVGRLASRFSQHQGLQYFLMP